MADITMCPDEHCPSRMKCYRWTAPPSENQSYAFFERDGDKCSDFIEAISKSQVRRLDTQTKGNP